MRLAMRLMLGSLLLVVTIVMPATAQTTLPPQLASPIATAQATPEKSRPTTYGTSAVSYVEIPPAEFVVWDSSYTYTSDDFGMGPRWGTSNGTGGVGFLAGLHLPSGAKPVYLELDFVDTNAGNAVFASLVECNYLSATCVNHPAAPGGALDCVPSGYICSGNAFSGGNGHESADLTPDGITVDNYLKSYRLYAATFAQDGSLKLAGMIVGYILQVSPAPGSATFNDVPTSSPQFQFVEALVAAGITAGCGGGNYCPNNPVTRGQMAVFLAKALGLQWP